MSASMQNNAPLPAGFRCLRCSYDLTSTRVRPGDPCVECGRVVSAADLEVWERHSAVINRSQAIRRRAMWMWPLIVTLTSGGLLFVSVRAAGYAFLVIGSVVAWSVLMGWAASLPVAPHLRGVARSTWVDHLWRLHFPWLWCGPVMHLVLAPIALAVGDKLAGEAAVGLFLIGVGAAIWALSGWRVGIAPEPESVRLWRHTAGALSLIPSLALALALLFAGVTP